MMIFLSVSYIVKMVVIPLHSLHLCTHQNHVVWSVSRYGAHKPIGFHAPFAIRCCSGIVIVDIDACIYYPHICTWLVYIMAIHFFLNLNLNGWENLKSVGGKLEGGGGGVVNIFQISKYDYHSIYISNTVYFKYDFLLQYCILS